ncbi:MAG: hypothetical protein RI979_955, partial [Pseudomonadota bacterium]
MAQIGQLAAQPIKRDLFLIRPVSGGRGIVIAGLKPRHRRRLKCRDLGQAANLRLDRGDLPAEAEERFAFHLVAVDQTV